MRDYERRYEELKPLFLHSSKQLDLPALIRSDDLKTKELDDAVEALQGHQLALREEMGESLRASKDKLVPRIRRGEAWGVKRRTESR